MISDKQNLPTAGFDNKALMVTAVSLAVEV